MNMNRFLLQLLKDETGSVSLTGGDVGHDGGGDSGVPADAPNTDPAPTVEPSLSSGNPQPTTSILNKLENYIKNDPSLKVFLDDKGEFNTSNLLKSYVHAQRKMGEKGIRVPDANSSDEEWQQFYNNIRPAELEKYEIKPQLSEGQELDEEMFNGFKEVAHKAGLNPKQAEQLLGWYNEKAHVTVQEQRKAAEDNYVKEIEQLKSDWGDAWDREVNLAKRALNEFADDDMKEYLQKTGLDKDVKMVRLFNKIGKGLMEDKFDQESHGQFGTTKEEAERKMAAIYGDMSHPYWNNQHPSHKHALDEMLKYQEILSR